MRECKTLSIITPEEFRAKAYADYLEDCNKNYLDLIAMVEEAATETDIDDYLEDNELEMTDQEYGEAVLAKVLANHGLTDSFSSCSVNLVSGYTKFGDLVKTVAVQSRKYANVGAQDSSTALTIAALPLTEISGSTSEDVPSGISISISEALEAMKNSLHASVVLQAAFAASAAAEVGERLTVYVDRIKTFFQNEFNDLSNTASYYKSLLMDKANSCKTLAQSFYQSLDLDARAAGDVQTTGTSIYEYTGASPHAALDFSSARKAVASTAKVVAGAVAAVGSVLWKGIKKVFNWGKQKVANIIEPFDIYTFNDAAESSSVDGWCYEVHKSSFLIDASPYDILHDRGWVSWVESHKGRWMKYETVFGELLWKYDDYGFGNNQQHTYFYANLYDLVFKFKPYPIDPEKVKQAMDYAGIAWSANYTMDDGHSHTFTADWGAAIYKLSNTYTSYARWWAFLQRLVELGPTYTVTETDEKTALGAFRLGVQLMGVAMAIAREEMTEGVEDPNTDYPYLSDPLVANIFYRTNDIATPSPTNADFISAVSGWNRDTSDPQFSLVNGIVPSNFSVDEDELITSAIAIFIEQGNDRAERPIDYYFVPYRNDVADFLSSRYAIKTDAQNQQALETFLTIVVVVVIVAIVAISAAVVIKKMKRAKFWKRTEFVGRSDNAMWNGATLSAKDKRKYLRYSRKLNAGSLASGDLQAGVSGGGLLSSLANSVLGDSSFLQGETLSSDINDVDENVTAINTTVSGVTNAVNGHTSVTAKEILDMLK